MDLQEQTHNGEEELNGITSQEVFGENVYQQLIEKSTFAIILINQRGIIQSFNEAAEKLWLYTAEEVIGKNVMVLMPQSHAEHHDYYLQNYLKTNQSSIMGVGRELDALRKDGKTTPILLTLSEAQNGEEKVFAAFISNISEKKNIELEKKNQFEELQATEEELRQNLEELQATQERQEQLSAKLKSSQMETEGQFKAINTAYAFIEFTPEGNILSANDIFLKTVGYTKEEIVGKHHRIFVEAEYASSLEYQNFWNELRNGKSFTDSFKRISKTGQDIWLDASYAPVFDENNQVIKVIKLAKDVTSFTISLKETSKFLSEIKKGNFDAEINLYGVEAEGELQNMIQANLGLRDTLKLIINEVNRVVNLAGNEGILSERLKLEAQEGAWNELVLSLNSLLSNISTPVLEMNQIIRNLADGDLTQRIEQESRGDIADMATALNRALYTLTDLLKKIGNTTDLTINASQEMESKTIAMRQSTVESSAAIQQMADGAQEQALRTDESSRLVEETLRVANDVSQKAQSINVSAEKGQENCDKGLDIIQSLIKNMEEISRSAQVSSNATEILSNRSDEISRILKVITNVANQTNLLSVNARIEAARAGEAGRGFKVVAEEIGKLADSSRQSADEIDKLIKDIQQDISETNNANKEMKENVKSGSSATQQVSFVFNEINSVSLNNVSLSKDILQASQNQKYAIDSVVKNIEKIVVVSEETASGTQQLANSSREIDRAMEELSQTGINLAVLAKELQKQLSQFKLQKN